MQAGQPRILLVEDNPGDALLACERLTEVPAAQVQVVVASTLTQAMGLLAQGAVDAVVTDLNLPDSQGLDTLQRIKVAALAAPVIVVSGQCDPVLRGQALALGAEEVFHKAETNSRLFSRSVLYVVERNRARLQQQRLQDLLDATPDAIVVVTAAGEVRFVNAAAVSLFRRPREALLAETLLFSASLGEAAEITLPGPDGPRHCELRIAHVHWDGELVNLAAIRDVTGRLQTEALQVRSLELELQNQQIREADRMKSAFLANMSHEIRTPMNAVIGLSYLLERTALNPQQADTLGKIKLASKSLLHIINNVLDLSKIEADQMQIEREPFALAELLSEMEALSGVQADAKGVGFAVHAAAALPQMLVGDATRLRQVLINLVNNAIKFTEQGNVAVTVTALNQGDGTALLRFAVKDSGIGIDPETLARLFTPFVQADSSTTRRFGGTGLGLSIVKQLVTLMGGRLGVSSEPQQGSEFWFELALPRYAVTRAPSEPVFEPIHGPGLQGVRVLVADDNPINLEVARRILQLEGAEVWLASNGREALNHLQAAPNAVDVVLMDVQMPELDGHDATRYIRRHLRLATLPVIALTAGMSSGEREGAMAAGMNDFVFKPFDPPSLVACIQKHLALPSAGSRLAPGVAVPPPSATDLGWPRIEGIDSVDAKRRLCGDLNLFGSLLRRLLDDFEDLEVMDSVALLPSMPALATRLHALKGVAGTLGAKPLHALAAQAETACRALQADQATALLGRLAVVLRALRLASAPVCSALCQTMLLDATEEGVPLDTMALSELRRELERFDPAAVDRFRQLIPQLRPLFGKDDLDVLRRQVDNLEFAEAALTLKGVEALASR